MNFFRNRKAARGVPYGAYTSEPHFDARKIRDNNFMSTMMAKEESQLGLEAKKNTVPDLVEAYLSYDMTQDEFTDKRKSR